MSHKKDVPVLAAVLSTKPDYLITGDAHFSDEEIRKRVRVMTAKEFLESIRKGRVRE